jgi:SAM-dependent methyltransferase
MLERFYDTDHPSPEDPLFQQIEECLIHQIGHDVEFYQKIIELPPKDIYDFCCGTGRLSVGLARAGHKVTGVDISEESLGIYQQKIRESSLEDSIKLIKQDIFHFDPSPKEVLIFGFNSLSCLGNSRKQALAIKKSFQSISQNGVAIFDISPEPRNLKELNLTPFIRRIDPSRNIDYQVFCGISSRNTDASYTIYGYHLDYTRPEEQQKLEWSYKYWHLDFEVALKIILDAGFKIKNIYGSHLFEPFTTQSQKMIFVCEKP